MVIDDGIIHIVIHADQNGSPLPTLMDNLEVGLQSIHCDWRLETDIQRKLFDVMEEMVRCERLLGKDELALALSPHVKRNTGAGEATTSGPKGNGKG